MKTRSLIRTAAATLVSGFVAAATLAGPGPQYWQQTEKVRAEHVAKHKAEAPAKPAQHPTNRCESCRTTPLWAANDRGPAGKGIPGTRVSGYSHSCSGCVGTNVTEYGKTKSEMKHAATCVTLGCCK